MRLSSNMMLGQHPTSNNKHSNFPPPVQAAWATSNNKSTNAHLAQNHTSGLTGLMQTRRGASSGGTVVQQVAHQHQAMVGGMVPPTRLPGTSTSGNHGGLVHDHRTPAYSSAKAAGASTGACQHQLVNNKASYAARGQVLTTAAVPQRYAPEQQVSHHTQHEKLQAHSKESTAPGSYSSYPSDTEDADGYLVSTEYLPDPLPEVCPRSKKMALGSITFSADQGKRLGVPVKDNSFFLRVEKCDEAFCDELNFQIERMHGFRAPAGVEDQTEYWPEGALYNYCQKPNQMLQREMDRVYRHWHDTRCGMSELYQRLMHVRNRGCF